MKTIIELKIESLNHYQVFPDEDLYAEEGHKKMKGEELKEFQESFAKELHKELLEHLEKMFSEEELEDYLLDRIENWVEGWETLKDAEIKITLKKKVEGER